MKEAEKILSDYAKYIKSLDKSELVNLIIGTDEKPPLLTRDEPKYSRPQILWAMNSLYKKADGKFIEGEVGFSETESFVENIMNEIEGMKWDKFYNYDYLRFDVKKPSLYCVVIILLLALIGGIYSVWLIISAGFKMI